MVAKIQTRFIKMFGLKKSDQILRMKYSDPEKNNNGKFCEGLTHAGCQTIGVA